MNPALIAMKAINGGRLTAAERAALTPWLLADLVIGGHIVLTEAERDRIPESLLANLAIGGHIELTTKEIQRLPESLRTQLEIGGHIDGNTDSLAATRVATSALSNSHERPAVTTSLEPENDRERAVYNALMLLANDREKVSVSGEHLQTICRAAPDFTIQVIDRNRTILLNTSGSHSAEIADLVRTIEWGLRGASQFIECHAIGGTEDTQFIHERLTNNPDDFSHEDLHALLGRFPRVDHQIRIAALNVLANYVASFAERIAAELPGMSQDVESLKRSIQSYGFDPDLNAILQKIDDELEKTADSFDQLGTIRHIRSFFERVHENVGKELQRRRPNTKNNTPLGKCGQAINYLKQKQVITEEFGKLAHALYGILSDDKFGVHALKAERDYTRLCRNMVVEYTVTLFFELERRLGQTGDK